MTTREIPTRPLTKETFAPFGDVIEPGENSIAINAGMCARHHDLAQLDFGSGRAGISLFEGKTRTFPYRLDLVERHPEGSQAFIPMSAIPLLITVCADQDGTPGRPQAFMMGAGQAVNLHRGIWHGVLAPMGAPGQQGLYAVVDHIGDAPNLEEHRFDLPWVIQSPR